MNQHWAVLMSGVFSAVAWAAPAHVVSERAAVSASPPFRFRDVPAPSDTDAANAATFSILAGERDGNGGRLSVLNDGRVPTDSDQPDASFFFGRGLSGRILVDLGERRDVRQVNTYSWHVGGRGPQVYELYALDDAAVDAARATPEQLQASGWRRVASVDSRPEGSELGGQYGVSVGDGKSSLGGFRYLLFDVSRTSAGDPFGATFFSEIDVHDGREHAPPPRGVVEVMKIGPYEMVFDTTEAPDLKPWVDATLKPVCAEWYPKIVDMLRSDGHTAPQRFSITFHADMDGIANCAGTRINCAAKWFRETLTDEPSGAVVHELVHVAQQYRWSDANPNPGWLVEGIPDYIRWFLYEPESQRPRPNPQRANYNDSYRTSGHFLDYVRRHHDRDIIVKLNAAMRQGRYGEAIWRQATGKSVEELGQEWKASLGGAERVD